MNKEKTKYPFTISKTDIKNFNPDYNAEKIIICTFSSDNIITLARKDQRCYEIFKELLKNDYIVYFHEKEETYLCKRALFKYVWIVDDLIAQGEIFYTLEKPPEEKWTKALRKKLLVIFSCIPSAETMYSHRARERCFPIFFDKIQRSLPKNVMLMRIMDLNFCYGSHYVNSSNYPNMENDIQNAIKKVMKTEKILYDDVVLYGASKGGTGALYHAVLGDYKCLATDPIISLSEYNGEKYRDSHFLKDLRRVDLTEEINAGLQQCERDKYTICSSNIKFNYDKVQQLNGISLHKIDILDDTITSHPMISRNCVPEQLAILNSMLSENLSFIWGNTNKVSPVKKKKFFHYG